MRGADHGGADTRLGPHALHAGSVDPRAHVLGELQAEIAERLDVAAIEIFGDAAGTTDLIDPAAIGDRIEPQQIDAAGARRLAPHRREQTIGHPRRQPLRIVRCKRCADRKVDAEFGAKAAAGLLHPHDPVFRIEADQPRADIERGEVDHLAVGADRDLGGAAADVDIHHRRLSRIERATAPEP